MATYSVTEDEVFIRCTDVGVVELYELDNLYIVPVKRKHWSHLGTLHLGVGKQYESLHIGNKDIRGAHLDAALHDLFDSRLMVNREGLCFLPSDSEGVHSDGGSHKIEYYRIFDRFNWGKYGVKAHLSTQWVCRDVLRGRPLVLHFDNDSKDEGNSSDDCEMYKQKLSEKEKELEEEKRARKELEEIVENKGTELVKKQEKIEELEKKKTAEAMSSSAGFNLYSYEHSNAQTIDEYYTNLAQSFTLDFPASKFNVIPGTSGLLNGLPHKDQFNISIMVPVKSVGTVSRLGPINIVLSGPIKKFDTNGWRVLRTATIYSYSGHAPTSVSESMAVYYDGKYGEIQAYGCKATLPIPTSAEDIAFVYNCLTYYIAGVGLRLVCTASYALNS